MKYFIILYYTLSITKKKIWYTNTKASIGSFSKIRIFQWNYFNMQKDLKNDLKKYYLIKVLFKYY